MTKKNYPSLFKKFVEIRHKYQASIDMCVVYISFIFVNGNSDLKQAARKVNHTVLQQILSNVFPSCSPIILRFQRFYLFVWPEAYTS